MDTAARKSGSPPPAIDVWLERGEIPFDEHDSVTITRQPAMRVYAPRSTKGVVLLLHGLLSHSGWFTRSCMQLATEGYMVIAPDRRGTGGHTEHRGHIDSYEQLIADMDAVLMKAKEDYPGLPVYLLGVSWGGKLAMAYEVLRPAAVDGIILNTPGLQVKPDLSLLAKMRIGLALTLGRGRQTQLGIPVDIPHLFTDDPSIQEWIRCDGNTLRKCSARFYLESKKLDILLKKKSSNCRTRILLMLAGRDEIAHNERTINFVLKKCAGNSLPVEVIVYPYARHTLDFESNWGEITKDIVSRLNEWNLNGKVEGSESRVTGYEVYCS